jgi:DNA (cytosine-5)-methyltransferase 1
VVVNHVRALDLCAGIGGFTRGLESSKFKVKTVAAVEFDDRARQTYSAMFGSAALDVPKDIRGIVRFSNEMEEPGPPRRKKNRAGRIRGLLPPVDLITAGLPCQPHSLMGNRKGVLDDRGALFYEVAEIVRALQPKFVIIENVRAIKSVNGGELYLDMLRVIQHELGYNVRVWTLDAQHYGVPQVRRRVFIVGSRSPLPTDAPPVVPPESREWMTTWHLLEEEVEARYYLSERILGTILKDQHKGYRRPADINRLTARPLTRTMHKMHRASQDNYYSDDFILGCFNQREWTIEKASAGSAVRRITPREAFRIQGFPERMISSALDAGVSDTQLYMQAGNAVPPCLVKAVVNHALV